jgi:hypothetical protein
MNWSIKVRQSFLCSFLNSGSEAWHSGSRPLFLEFSGRSLGSQLEGANQGEVVDGPFVAALVFIDELELELEGKCPFQVV